MSLKNALAGIKEAQAEPELHQPRAAARKVTAPPPKPAAVPREARPVGKRSSPEFTQIGPYVRKSTKKAVELRLIGETGERDLSGLIERLLIQWLAS